MWVLGIGIVYPLLRKLKNCNVLPAIQKRSRANLGMFYTDMDFKEPLKVTLGLDGKYIFSESCYSPSVFCIIISSAIQESVDGTLFMTMEDVFGGKLFIDGKIPTLEQLGPYLENLPLVTSREVKLL